METHSNSQIAPNSSSEISLQGDHDPCAVNGGAAAVRKGGRTQPRLVARDSEVLALINGPVRMSDGEIATLKGLSIPQVKSLIARARRRGVPIERPRILLPSELGAKIIALVNGPVRMTNAEISAATGATPDQVRHTLGRARKAGTTITREPWRRPLRPDNPTDDWPADKIAQLRALWPDRSLGGAEIGRRIGMSKSAVVGKAHRLGLPGRPSPIKARDPGAPPRSAPAPPAPRHTLPPLPSANPKRLVPAALNRPLASVPRPPRVVTRQPPAPVAFATAHTGRVNPCCWPIGDIGTREFHFCDDPTLPGRVYCEDHDNRAHGRARGHAAPLAGSGAVLAGAGP